MSIYITKLAVSSSWHFASSYSRVYIIDIYLRSLSIWVANLHLLLSGRLNDVYTMMKLTG